MPGAGVKIVPAEVYSKTVCRFANGKGGNDDAGGNGESGGGGGGGAATFSRGYSLMGGGGAETAESMALASAYEYSTFVARKLGS